MADRYKVVTLCGSTKFKKEFIEIQKQLTLEGYIVLSVGLFGHSGDEEAFDDKTKDMLDDMHKRKIDMSDEIFVIDVDEYIGESTRSEINYAKEHHKVIRYFSHPDMIVDQLGGVHDECVGWNPKGVFCGECSYITCKSCPNKDKEEN